MKNKTTKSGSKKISSTVKKGAADVPGRLALLNKQQPHAVLATVSDDQPYASLVAYAVTPDMKGLVFATPRKTRKYRNLMKNRDVCLMIDSRTSTGNDYMKTEAVTITGPARAMKKGKAKEDLTRIFLKKHPQLKGFVHADSTALIHVKITRCIHVSSFQTISEWP